MMIPLLGCKNLSTTTEQHLDCTHLHSSYLIVHCDLYSSIAICTIPKTKTQAQTLQPWKPVEQSSNPWAVKISAEVLKIKRTADCFAFIDEDPKIELKLPKRDCNTGFILKHACSVVDSVLKEWGPAVYKIGYTHCPKYRMHNRQFGYLHDKHQAWEKMIVLYCSHESVGPAFLEAALIHKHKGHSSAFNRHVACLPFLIQTLRYCYTGYCIYGLCLDCII